MQKKSQRTKKKHVIKCKVSAEYQCLDVGDGGASRLKYFQEVSWEK